MDTKKFLQQVYRKMNEGGPMLILKMITLNFTKMIQYAKTLLSSGGYSIAEISEKSRFKDVKYFSSVVKKEYGVPPSKLYRRIKE